MAFVLKIAREHFSPERTFVAEKLSDRDISESDFGEQVYVWFTDSLDSPSQLFGRGELSSYDLGEGPQRGDPSQSTNGFFVGLSEFDTNVVRSLGTNDLERFRDDPEASPMHHLGKLHDNRNERIKRVPASTAAVLAARF